MNEDSRIERIHDKLDEIRRDLSSVMTKHSERLSKVETIQKMTVWIGGAVFTLLTSFILSVLFRQ